MDNTVALEPPTPRSMRLEKDEEEIRELRDRVDRLEMMVQQVLGLDISTLR